MTYKLFSTCILSKGYNISLIIDIQRDSYFKIPNSLYDILCNNELLDFDSINEFYNNNKIIREYFTFLKENELIFECDEQTGKNFPPLETHYKIPSKISNIVIEVSKTLEANSINKFINDNEVFGLTLIYYNALENITDFIEAFNDSILRDIKILYPYNEDYKNVIKLKNENLRISNLIFYNCPNITKEYEDIYFSQKNISSFKFCGSIENYFTVNKELYLESLNHNSCLHKKISIDKDGFIRNCPSMPQHFGNIKDTSLENALNHPDFRKYWNVNKDIIEVCKDCEFRHICTDCRAYTERTHFEEDIDLSKPLKCGYNPYTNEWAEWSTNPLKQKAIEYYGMQELVKKDA